MKKKMIVLTAALVSAALLTGCGGMKKTAQPDVYNIYVTDETGAPVEGATVRFCSEEWCRLGTTDENGCASFEEDPAVYEATVLKAPEGYQPNDTVYLTEDTYGDLSIVLERE